MDNMIELLRAFEYKIWEVHKNDMPNVRARQCASSFIVHYVFGDDGHIESIFLRATKDSLCVKILHGSDPECEANILYTTPEIYQTAKAEKILDYFVTMMDQGFMVGYDIDIEFVARAIKKEYDA